jgi:WD40 repeat protein
LADDGRVQVFESTTGQPIVRLVSPSEVLEAIFIADGSQLCAWSKDKRVRIWDLPSGKLVNEFDLDNDLKNESDTVAVSPNGRLLLTAHANNTVRVRDLATGKQLIEYQTEPQGSPRCLAFSPDSRLAAAGSNRGWVYLWRMPP